jgi:predicted RNA-binding Zn ribbon-like protein
VARNQLQQDLLKLRQLVDFAESDSMTFPAMLVETPHGLVTLGRDSRQGLITVADLTAVREELRTVLRKLAAGEFAQVQAPKVNFNLYAHPASYRTGDKRQFVSSTIDGSPRDCVMSLAVRLLTTTAVHRLRRCAAPDCGRVFVKATVKDFCSTRCQSRTYMREMRARERKPVRTPRRRRKA